MHVFSLSDLAVLLNSPFVNLSLLLIALITRVANLHKCRSGGLQPGESSP